LKSRFIQRRRGSDRPRIPKALNARAQFLQAPALHSERLLSSEAASPNRRRSQRDPSPQKSPESRSDELVVGQRALKQTLRAYLSACFEVKDSIQTV